MYLHILGCIICDRVREVVGPRALKNHRFPVPKEPAIQGGPYLPNEYSYTHGHGGNLVVGNVA